MSTGRTKAPRDRDLWKFRNRRRTAFGRTSLPQGFERSSAPPLYNLQFLAQREASAQQWGLPSDVGDELESAVWEMVRRCREAGYPPHPDHLAPFVRRWAVPPDLRSFVVDVLTGAVKQRRGKDPRDPLTTLTIEGTKRAAWAYRVLRWKRAYQSRFWRQKRLREHRRTNGARSFPPKADPHTDALSQVEAESGISTHTLDAWLYGRYRHRR